MIVSRRKRTPGLTTSRVRQAHLLGRRPPEHHVELRVAEDEGVALVDQRHAGVVAERLRQHGRELEAAEARTEDEDARPHPGEPTQCAGRPYASPCAMEPSASDEYILDTPVVREFVSAVRASIGAAASPEDACAAIRPGFAELLADPRRGFPTSTAGAHPESGMGGGIGQWLLFRAVGPFALALLARRPARARRRPSTTTSPGASSASTRGTQDEEIYAEQDGSLTLVESRSLEPGDFYALIPPRDDIHRVRTTSSETSVSIHLLTNDTGCVWRHAYDPDSGRREPFRSGYVNVDCPP